MKTQSKIIRVVNIGDIFLYEKADLMFTVNCIKICFRPMTTEEWNLLREKQVGKFSIDYCVCIRKIEQQTITKY